MFTAKISDARQWKNILAAISTLIEEADLNAAPEGIKLRSMDPSHVAMVDFEWNKSAFEEYTCLQPTKIRLNVSDIVKKLRGAGQDPLEMAYDENTRKLSMVIKGKWKTTFTLPTLDPGDEEVPTPKIAFNTKIITNDQRSQTPTKVEINTIIMELEKAYSYQRYGFIPFFKFSL